MIDIQIIPILKDNYAYLLTAENGESAIIDPGEAQPIIDTLEAQQITLDYIMNTHHHGDHIAGNTPLKNRYDAKLVGPAAETNRISGLDIMLDENSSFSFGGEDIKILETPGHTAGGICLYLPKTGAVFTGDTLFLMGTGRLFEGTPQQMWTSLEKIMALPDETLIYCGHEYTQKNGEFCLHIEPDNVDIRSRMEEIKQQRAAGHPTIPATIREEMATNVFLRAGSTQRYAELRSQKDSF